MSLSNQQKHAKQGQEISGNFFTQTGQAAAWQKAGQIISLPVRVSRQLRKYEDAQQGKK
ncbi:hypothetical protein ACYSJL_07890 [Lactobacillus delbrueckii]|uniref:hypothetical protein n=1 Tax=Lactobacillus delbrueckii TaxID=1584 RepID=UPI0039953645